MPGRPRTPVWLARAALLLTALALVMAPYGAAPARADMTPQPRGTADAAKKGASPAAPTPTKEDDEIRIGRQAAAEVEREYKLVKDQKQIDRITRIGLDIAAVCDEPGYHYTFKILDTDEVNAESLPGGFTYVTKGLLGFVRSDDEMAGVLAHEIAHAARHHVLGLMKREARANQNMLLGIVGAVLLGGARSGGFGNMLFGAQMLKAAYMNGYSEKDESEADRVGCEYLIKCGKYNPVGELTMIERLARDEAREAAPQMGIFQDHPPSVQRAKALEDLLKAHGIAINRLTVQDNLHATARDASTKDAKAAEVVFNDVVVVKLAGNVAAAQAVADHLNTLMQHNLQMRDVRLGPDQTSVLALNETLVSIRPEDAALQKKTPAEVAKAAAESLTRGLWKAYMDQVF